MSHGPIEWRSLGQIKPSESARVLKQLETGPAVWKLVYQLGGERIAYIGSSAKLRDRIVESVESPTQGNWREYLCFDLTQEAGATELLVCCEGEGKEIRDQVAKDAIAKELEAGTQLLNKEGRSTEVE